MLQELSVSRSLAFLRERTGEDELSLITRALDLGLNELIREAVEQAFIDDEVARDEAVGVLGIERVEQIEYARQALVQDVERGLDL